MALPYKDLIVWQKAMRATREVYRLAPKLPKEETPLLRSLLDEVGRMLTTMRRNRR
jgi:hypothetical protein